MSSLSQKLLETRKNKQEGKRQALRKISEKSSRLLDGYYNSKIHTGFWKYSGKVKEGHKYVYGDTGLGYSVKGGENNFNTKVSSKSSSDIKEKFLEFQYMENNEVILIIEHCSNCEEHIDKTNHENDIYRKIAKLLQGSVMSQFPFIKCCLKPIDTSDRRQVKRIGGLELYLATKFNNELKVEEIFSKLKSGTWPNTHNILSLINYAMPVIDIKCLLYDKDDDECSKSLISENSIINDNNNQDKRNICLPGRYENIKVNLYSYISPKVYENSYEITDLIDINSNPKRKIESAILESEFSKTISLNNGGNGNNNINEENNSKGNNNTVNNTQMKTNNDNDNSNIENSEKKEKLIPGEIIENMSIINKNKKKLLSSGYSDKEGILIFKNVPYDSYIIEIENNKKFSGCGMLIKFNQIYTVKENSTNYNNGNYIINKLFGLTRQIHSYIEVFVYSRTKEGENFDMNLITGAKVSIFPVSNKENKEQFFLVENAKIKGKYEISCDIGEAELCVEKNGMKSVKRNIKVKQGLNKVNVEMSS